MKTDASRIPYEGLSFKEDIPAPVLDLEIDIIKFSSPVHVKVDASRITNAVTIDMFLAADMRAVCSRCLKELEINLNKHLKLNYPLEKAELMIDLDSYIREEIIFSYPIKPLCKVDCKGLCPQCGKNLNEGGCSCAVT